LWIWSMNDISDSTVRCTRCARCADVYADRARCDAVSLIGGGSRTLAKGFTLVLVAPTVVRGCCIFKKFAN